VTDYDLDSLVSSQIYEIIKTIYSTTPDAIANPISTESVDSAPRIKVLQSTLGQLRLNNIATLDAITTHFTRLIDLTSADETYISNLAQALAPCILRPRTESSLTHDERHAYRLIRDLFDHKEAIFGELKRQSTHLGAMAGTAGLNIQTRATGVRTWRHGQKLLPSSGRGTRVPDPRVDIGGIEVPMEA
jgi:RhoGAP domain